MDYYPKTMMLRSHGPSWDFSDKSPAVVSCWSDGLGWDFLWAPKCCSSTKHLKLDDKCLIVMQNSPQAKFFKLHILGFGDSPLPKVFAVQTWGVTPRTHVSSITWINPQDPCGSGREMISESCHLTFTHVQWYMCWCTQGVGVRERKWM